MAEPLPELATCSYTGYQPEMGTAVKISSAAPRYIKMPAERYGNREHWIYLRELAPSASYRDASDAVFLRAYTAHLEHLADQIEFKLRLIPVEHGRLVLLCFEKDVSNPLACHRRVFAEWWEKRTGHEVPELGDGK